MARCTVLVAASLTHLSLHLASHSDNYLQRVPFLLDYSLCVVLLPADGSFTLVPIIIFINHLASYN